MLEVADFVIRQDDTAPRLYSDLTDGAGNAVDVSDATVRLHLHGLTVASDLDLAAGNDPEVDNRVFYDWQEGDTGDAGYYAGEWQVTYTNGQVETFPNSGWFLMQVVEQLA